MTEETSITSIATLPRHNYYRRRATGGLAVVHLVELLAVISYRFSANASGFKTVETPSYTYLLYLTNVFLATIDFLQFIPRDRHFHDVGAEVPTIMHSASFFGRITITDQCWGFPIRNY
jgi:hypothetical protein